MWSTTHKDFIFLQLNFKKMNKSIALKAKKAIGALALALLLAQGLIMLPTKAVSLPDENGSCCTSCGCICGLNGQNYADKIYTKGGASSE